MMSITNNRNDLLQNAKDLLQRATEGIAKRRKLKSARSVGLTNLITNAPTLHTEEEVKLYIDAAVAFLICSKWTDAAEAYAQAAWLMGNHLRQNEEAAILYTEAGQAAMRFGINGAVKHFKQAVSYYCDCGKLDQAGRIHSWIAKGYEESNQTLRAIDEYKLTLKYFKGKDMTEQVLMCQRRIAHLLCLNDDLKQASELYQSIGLKELESNLTKYNAHVSLFKSALLLLPSSINAGKPYNFTKVNEQIKWFKAKDFRFEVSAACDFLHNIILILSKRGNVLHLFIDHVYDYDSLYPMDPVCLNILEDIMRLHYKEQIEDCSNASKINLN